MGGGQGLRGMRERIAAVEAGPTAEGWLVEARRQQLEQLRIRVTTLAATLPGTVTRTGDAGELVELVEGQAQMRHRVEQMQLGAQREITRRVGHILSVLDAQTRFQAGIQAARRGWL